VSPSPLKKRGTRRLSPMSTEKAGCHLPDYSWGYLHGRGEENVEKLLASVSPGRARLTSLNTVNATKYYACAFPPYHTLTSPSINSGNLPSHLRQVGKQLYKSPSLCIRMVILPPFLIPVPQPLHSWSCRAIMIALGNPAGRLALNLLSPYVKAGCHGVKY